MNAREALSRLHEYVPGERRPGVLKLSSNENPLGTSPAASSAISRTARDVHMYPDGGAVELRTAIAGHYGLDRTRVITGNGSDELMVMTTASFLNPGDIAIAAEHTFSVYGFATNLFDGYLVTTAMTDGRHDVGNFVRAVRENERTRLVFVCNPNNPTGTYLTSTEVRTLLDAVPPEVLVVLDEAYCEYMDADDAPDGVRLLEHYPNLLVLRTFSKIYGLAGLRVGYGMGHPSIIATLEKTRMPFNTNLVAQQAALAALTDGDFVERSLSTNRSGRQRLYRELERRAVNFYPTQANFVCLRVEEPSGTFAERLARHGVTIRPLKSFGLDEWIRVTIGTNDQIDRFLLAFDAALSETSRRVHATAD